MGSGTKRTLIAALCAVAAASCAPVAAAPNAVSRDITPVDARATGDAAIGRATASGHSGSPKTTLGPSTTATSSSSSATTTTTTTSAPTSTTSATTSTTTTTTVLGWPRKLSLAFTGDTLIHSPLWRGAARHAAAAGQEGLDFRPMLSQLAPLLDPVDLAVCHLEVPIAPLGEAYSTYPRYGAPEEVADAISAAGYDRCSTASNHTLDRGTPGVTRTVEVLESRGIGQSGMAREPAEIMPTVFDAAGVAVSHLSYTFSYNGLLPPAGEEWRSAIIDPERIVADAALARELGAEVVIVSLHWGNEKWHSVSWLQREQAEAITASGLVDVLVGHHAHVVQPIEQVNGTWVVFGLGNILSNLHPGSSWPAASQDAMVVTFDLVVGSDGRTLVGRPVAHPTWVDVNANWVVLPVLTELGREDLSPERRAVLERSLARTAEIVGEFIPPR
jgi:poly-gamma-glutamate synthesis protein (capsule biosynthesis protein)